MAWQAKADFSHWSVPARLWSMALVWTIVWMVAGIVLNKG
jgi:hypothetical protein